MQPVALGAYVPRSQTSTTSWNQKARKISNDEKLEPEKQQIPENRNHADTSITSPSRATSITLASQGASLALTDINTAALATLLSDLAATNSQNDHKTYTLDVGNSAACNSVIASAVHDLGHIDFVFNCAGINPTALEITETSDEYFDKLVNTNLRGPYNVTRAVVPHLDRGAAIVNVSSVEGLRVTKEFSIVSWLGLPFYNTSMNVCLISSKNFHSTMPPSMG